jgi:hypothetical protein
MKWDAGHSEAQQNDGRVIELARALRFDPKLTCWLVPLLKWPRASGQVDYAAKVVFFFSWIRSHFPRAIGSQTSGPLKM